MKKNTNFGNYLKKIKKRRSFICGLKSFKMSNNERRFLLKYNPWGIILFSRNIKNINQTKLLTDSIKKLFKDKNYPILIDEEGGRVSRIRKIFDTTLFSAKFFGDLYSRNQSEFKVYLYSYVNQISYLLKLMGININTVPVLDVLIKNTNNIIGNRSYSRDPKIVSIIGDKVIELFHNNKIITIMKHIPGHGLAKVDSHYRLPTIHKKVSYLTKNDFLAFMKKKSLLSMTAHIKYSHIDKHNCATNSQKVIKLIRKKIGFKGLIITDDISMKALKGDISLKTIKSFTAGCNLVLHCNSNMSEMMKVANNSPFLNDFIIKKTSQIIKKLS